MMSTELQALTWDSGKYLYQQKLGNFIQFFQINLPTNGHGIPLQLINPLLLAEHILDCKTTDDLPDDVIERAKEHIDFEEGFPVIDGLPIWERLDGEPIVYYKLLKEYREMLYVQGSRAISRLADAFHVVGKNLNILAKVYHWHIRCRAYDLFKQMEREKKRQFEVEKLEAKHAKVANALLGQAIDYLEKHPEQLNPKIAVQMVQMAMKAERLSLGLNAEKPGSGDSPSSSIRIEQNTSVALDSTPPKIEGSITSNLTNQGSITDQDVSHLQSILHILDKSGALDKTKVVDADFTVVEDNEDKKFA